MDRYADAIEYDLHAVFNLDLVDFFRGKYSWRKLEALLAQLPAGSAFWAARADDDEAAEAWLKNNPKGRKKAAARPQLHDMSFTNQMLIQLANLNAYQIAVLRTMMGEKSVKPVTIPAPRTAVERAEDRVELLQVNDLVTEVEDAMKRWQG